MIRGYPSEPSVHPGEALGLHCSTPEPAFRVEFYRQGASLERVGASGVRPGRLQPAGDAGRDWRWYRELFEIPADWRPGVYLALLIEVDRDGEDIRPPDPVFDGRDSRVLFVVRPRAPSARILYKLAWATYHAYNATGGRSMYTGDGWLPASEPVRLTTRRPGGGTGGDLSFPGDVDAYDPDTPREGFAHWDAPFIAWLESNGYAVDYCTDLDLEREPSLPSAYRLVLSVGHDEYWSAGVRDAFESFARAGGNVAFFGGNTCWWKVAFENGGEGMSCLHPPLSRERSDHWWRHRPENTLTGVSYRNGGGWWRGERDAIGFTVQHAPHWIFEGTGLADGDVFGADSRLVGYECDGASLRVLGNGLRIADGSDGTPSDFAVLGHAALSERWQDRARGANAAATLGLHAPGGIVFTCATTDWARVLAQGDARVDRVTRNVLDRLSSDALRIHAECDADADDAAFFARLDALGAWPADAVVRYRAFDTARGVAVPTGDACWRVSVDGETLDVETADDGSLRVTLPRGPAMVTVSIRTATNAFGAVTRRLLSVEETLQVRLLIDLQRLVQATVPALAPGLPEQPGNRPFGALDWHPLRDGLRASLSPPTARDAANIAERIRRTAGLLAP